MLVNEVMGGPVDTCSVGLCRWCAEEVENAGRA